MRISIPSLLEFARGGGYDYAALVSALSARFERDPSSVWQVDWGLDSLPAHRVEATAFWIDAYNAAAITGVIRNWPLQSVTDVRGYFSDPRYDVFGRTLSLDDIEKKMLFGSDIDPRIHFAIVCASESCPPLHPEPFQSASDLDSLLDVLAGRLVNDTTYVRFDPEEGVVHLSKLFDWYADHFASTHGSVLGFIAHYHQDGEGIAGRSWKKRFVTYDWSLNQRPRE